MRILVIDPNSVRPAEQAKAAALAALGHRVTLLAPAAFTENYARLHARRPAGAAYRLVLGRAAGKPPNRTVWSDGLSAAFRPRPEAVLTLSDENHWFTFQALAWRELWAPRALFVCHSWQNLDFDRRRHPQPCRALYLADTAGERLVFARASAIAARNRRALGVLRRRGFGGPLVHIPWAVDVDRLRPAAARPDRPYTIGYVGRLAAEKGVEDLLAACARLAAPHRLVLVGRGPDEERLRVLARESGTPAEFRPLVAHEDMAAVYHDLDVLVLPSRTTHGWMEQFGRVLAEAMACGVAVAGSDSGAIPEVIGDPARVFPEGDAAALTRVLEALADPARRAAAGLRGRLRTLTYYSWRAWAAATSLLLTELAAGRTPGPPLETA